MKNSILIADIRARIWRNLPNAISMARLLAAPILAAAVIAANVEVFTWLLLGCLISDIVDGWIARKFDLRSKLGATLDSTADLLVSIIATAGVFRFRPDFVSEHYISLLVVIALYAGENMAALWRYGRLSSFHTLLSRAAAYAQGGFVMSLFLWGYQSWLFMGMIALSTVAYLEEFVLLWMFGEWRSDVRGLYWVVPAQKEPRGDR